jgi:hypothetical protein
MDILHLTRYIMVPLAFTILLFLLVYWLKKKSIINKSFWKYMFISVLFSVLFFLVPLWYFDVYNELKFDMVHFDLFGVISSGVFDSMMHQLYIVFALAFMLTVYKDYEADGKKFEFYSWPSKFIYMFCNFLGCYFMQGFWGVLTNDTNVSAVYRGLHYFSLIAFFLSLFCYIKSL